MMQAFPYKPQTRVKHEILRGYLKRWAGIVLNGLRRPYRKAIEQGTSSSFTVRFAYIDAFAATGKYQQGGELYSGSPLIGIEALDSARTTAHANATQPVPYTYALLFEKDPYRCAELLETLKSKGYDERLQLRGRFMDLWHSGIAVRCGEYQGHIEEVLDFTARPYTWSFYLLDPYGPKGLEMDVVRRIVGGKRHDVMINFPYQDLLKKTGSERKGTPEHEEHLRHYDALYGTSEWRGIARAHQGDDLETELVQFYVHKIKAIDPGVTVKSIPLLFPDRQRTMFYLILTTHDPTGALAMNHVIHGAKQMEYKYRVQWKTQKAQERIMERSGGWVQQSLFDDEIAMPSAERDYVHEAAERIYAMFRGNKAKYRQVLHSLADSVYFPEEVRKAVFELKRKRRVNFSLPLHHETLITFR